MVELSITQITLLLILCGAFILLLTERIRIDVTAVIIIVALAITGILPPQAALSGFGSEPAIVAASIFVLSGAMRTTGLSDRFGLWISRLAGSSPNRILTVIMMAVAALSAFTHHLTITAVMVPVTLKLSQDNDVPASRLLMPMSFAASLGTTITILGAPAFLIADRLLHQADRPGLGIFSIAPIGIALTITGLIFILLAGRFLLPARNGKHQDPDESRFRLDGFYTEIIIGESSSFINKKLEELQNTKEHFQVAGWLRQGRAISRLYENKRLKANDILLVRTNPDELATIKAEPGIDLYPLYKYQNGNHSDKEDTNLLVQAVLAPGSELAGSSIGRIDFLAQYGLIVVGIWRRSAWLRAELSKVRLHEGDVLLLYGRQEAFDLLEHDRSFLMLVPFKGEPFMRHRAPLAGLILIGSILVAALGVIPVEIAFLAGALIAVMTRCLNIQQAYRSIDTRIFVFIAGAIPLGLAMQSTGTADLIANNLFRFLSGWPPLLVLFLLFIISALLTQMMSDAGTVALLGPIVISLASALGHPPESFVVIVAVAAVASFLTPIGHHGNLLVYGPGGYQFSDFIRVGTPLTLLVGIVSIFVVQLIWPI